MPKKWNPANADDLIERYVNGRVSELEMARDCGVGRTAFRRLLTDHDVIPRNRSEGMLARMSRATPEQRAAWATAAHAAVRGRRLSATQLARRARGKQQTLALVGMGEETMRSWLLARRLTTVPQFALDKYNIDLAAPRLAIEITFHTSRPTSRASERRKVKDLTEWGFSVVYVWMRPGAEMLERCADEVIAFRDFCDANPSTIGHHLVIRGSGETFTRGRGAFDEIA